MGNPVAPRLDYSGPDGAHNNSFQRSALARRRLTGALGRPKTDDLAGASATRHEWCRIFCPIGKISFAAYLDTPRMSTCVKMLYIIRICRRGLRRHIAKSGGGSVFARPL
jgi:hypothetical protein